MSIRVEGPATCRKAIDSTNSAATISMRARTLSPGDGAAPAPDRTHREGVGIEGDEISTSAGRDATPIADAQDARGVAGRVANRARRREAERRDIAHRVGHRDLRSRERAVGE